MLATDVEPDRLTAATGRRRDFVDQLPAGSGSGLVAFSTEARLVVAPTTDRAQVHAAIDEPPGRRRHGAGRRDRDLARGRRPTRGPPRPTPTPGGHRPHRRRPPRRRRRPRRMRHRAAARRDRPAVGRRQLDRRDRAARRRRPRRPPSGIPVYTIALGTRTAPSTSRTRSARCRRSTSRPTPRPWRRSPRRPAAASSRRRRPRTWPRSTRASARKVGYTQEEQEVTQWFAAAALVLVLAGAGLAALWFNRIP